MKPAWAAGAAIGLFLVLIVRFWHPVYGLLLTSEVSDIREIPRLGES